MVKDADKLTQCVIPGYPDPVSGAKYSWSSPFAQWQHVGEVNFRELGYETKQKRTYFLLHSTQISFSIYLNLTSRYELDKSCCLEQSKKGPPKGLSILLPEVISHASLSV